MNSRFQQRKLFNRRLSSANQARDEARRAVAEAAELRGQLLELRTAVNQGLKLSLGGNVSSAIQTKMPPQRGGKKIDWLLANTF